VEADFVDTLPITIEGDEGAEAEKLCGDLWSVARSAKRNVMGAALTVSEEFSHI
jgi:hypothetical protein